MDIYPQPDTILSQIRASNAFIGKHFRSYEFDCKNCVCQTTLISLELVRRLDLLRDELGQQLVITSGFRCQRKQTLLTIQGYETASGISPHQLGCAADLTSAYRSGLQLEAAARKVGFTSVGVAQWWIHADIREGVRRWEYLKRNS